MGVHIYCLVGNDLEAPGDVAGIEGARVAVARSGSLGVWYTEHEAMPAADVAAIRAHHAVVQCAMTPEHTPVPLRFGQWFASASDALEQVGAHETKWLEQLARFARCVEFGVRIVARTGGETAQDVHLSYQSGAAYMAELARRHAATQRRRAEGEALAMQVQSALTDLVVDVRIDYPAASGPVSLAHLVARERLHQYRIALDEIRRARPDLTLQCSGPWPPYSFVA